MPHFHLKIAQVTENFPRVFRKLISPGKGVGEENCTGLTPFESARYPARVVRFVSYLVHIGFNAFVPNEMSNNQL